MFRHYKYANIISVVYYMFRLQSKEGIFRCKGEFIIYIAI